MKNLLVIAFCFCSLLSAAQVPFYQRNTTLNVEYPRVRTTVAMVHPSDTTVNKEVNSVAVVNGVVYVKNTSAWVSVAPSASDIYTTNGTLSSNRAVAGNQKDFFLTDAKQIYFKVNNPSQAQQGGLNMYPDFGIELSYSNVSNDAGLSVPSEGEMVQLFANGNMLEVSKDSITVNGKNIVRSINGSGANVTGDVSINLSNYLTGTFNEGQIPFATGGSGIHTFASSQLYQFPSGHMGVGPVTDKGLMWNVGGSEHIRDYAGFGPGTDTPNARVDIGIDTIVAPALRFTKAYSAFYNNIYANPTGQWTNTWPDKSGPIATTGDIPATVDLGSVGVKKGTGVLSFGTSIEVPINATTSHVQLLANSVGGVFSNKAVTTTNGENGSYYIIPLSFPDSTSVRTWSYGINELRTNGISSANFVSFSQRYVDYVSMFLANAFASEYVLATDSRITYTGTWAVNGSLSITAKTPTGMKASNTSGAQVAFSVTGSEVMIPMPCGNQGFNATNIDFYVDNVIVKSINPTITPSGGNAQGFWYPILLKFSYGTHAIKIVKNSNYMFFDHYIVLKDPANTKTPAIVTSPERCVPSSFGTTAASGYDSLRRTTFDSLLFLETKYWSDRGFPARYVDINKYYNPYTQSDDGLHPNDLGHASIYRAELENINISTSTLRENLLIPAYNSYTNLLAAKQNALTLTTTGTNGASTLTNGVLNIPQYSGGASPSGTSGSVAFFGANGSLSQSNSKFFWDSTNSRLGIGATPSEKLHISASETTGTGVNFLLENTGSTGSPYSVFVMKTNGSNDGQVLAGKSANSSFGIVNGITFGGGSSSQDIGFRTGSQLTGSGTGPSMIIKSSGNIGISVALPTAKFHLPPGTATAGTAPFKYTSGVLNTIPEAGAKEYDGTDEYLNISTTRYISFHGLKGSGTLDFTSTAAQTSSELTITVAGAADGDVVSVGVPNVSSNANSCFTARVSAANTVSVKFNNFSSGAIDPASGVFKVTVIK